jgi:hypothetical protein
MPKPRPSKQPWDIRAADVLAGRRTLDPGDLIDLIHEVNPTGRGRGAAETAARYTLKSRLQSVLIDRFAADLEVAPDPDDPAVVAIRHRYRRHDACHAVIATLDDDARSWVQREIDLAATAGPASAQVDRAREEEAPAPSDADDDLGEGGLLAAGEAAQAAYDYERAGHCFSRAVAASGGGVAAAVAFLSFTVDAMAADDEALAVAGRLPAATLADPRVGLLLALAAARSGDEARALRHLSRTSDPRAAEVLALLARRALDAGDADRAARHVRAAEEADPAHPDVRALEDAIAAARAAERAPRETQLFALLAAGRDAEALAEAQAILGRWPESEPARRAARQIEERQREDAGRRLLAEAEEALARGETAVALEHLQRALERPLAAPDRERALGRVREVEAIEHERLARARVDHVAALLDKADRARALTAYVELDKEERASVRARAALPELPWLDAIPAARPGGRVRAAVEAVLALARASALVEKDPAAAAALVASHEHLLEDLPPARTIEQRARAAAAEERARRAAAELREAEEDLAGGHLTRARATFDRIDLRALPEGERARAAAFDAELTAAEERQREVRRFERLRAAGAFAAARDAASALGERDGGAERARWAAEAAAIAEHVRTRYAVKVDELSGGPELLQNATFFRYGRDAAAWVADDGRELVLCTAEHAWMFLRFVDLETGRVVRGVRVALDEPMNDVRLTVHEGGVTVIGNSGLFEFTTPGGELSQRFERNWSHDRGPCFTDGLHAEGTRLLWGGYGIDDDDVVKIVDLDGEPGVKTFAGFAGPLPVTGATPPRLVLHKSWWLEEENKERHAIQAYEPGGAQIGRAEMRWTPTAFVAHPSGAGMVMLSSELDGGGTSKLALVEFSDRLEVIASSALGVVVSWPTAQSELTCARDAGLVFVLFTQKDAQNATLLALRRAGPGLPLAEHYRAPVPLRTTLAHDRSGRRAFALTDHPGGLAIAALGLTPPELPESGPIRVLPDAFENVNWCGLHSGNQAVYVYLSLRKLPPAERDAAIARLEEERAADPQKLVELFHAMLHGDWLEPAERILARAEASYPEDPGCRVAPFALLVARREWPALLAALDAAGPERFEGPFLQHYHHLRATAYARAGDVDEALRHLALAEALSSAPGSHCGHAHLRTAFDSLPGGADDLAFDSPTSAQLVAVLRAADARMAGGDAAGAIEVLERPLTWDLREVHSLGRLAAAHLALPAASAAERFRRGLALATFIECMESDSGGSRREGLAPGLAWTEDRLDALRTAAIAWMEAEQGTARAPSWLR